MICYPFWYAEMKDKFRWFMMKSEHKFYINNLGNGFPGKHTTSITNYGITPSP